VQADDHQDLEAILDLASGIQESGKGTQLGRMLSAHPGKVVVFTEFVPTLDHLARVCEAHGISHSLFSGDFSQAEKDAAIALFRDQARVLLSTRKFAASRRASNRAPTAVWRAIPSASTPTIGTCCARLKSGFHAAPPICKRPRKSAAAPLPLDWTAPPNWTTCHASIPCASASSRATSWWCRFRCWRSPRGSSARKPSGWRSCTGIQPSARSNRRGAKAVSAGHIRCSCATTVCTSSANPA
jgi:hypothetical protein